MGIKNIIYTIWPEKCYTAPLPAWCYIGDDLASALNIHLDVIKAYIFQIEEGEEGHPHIQLFVQWKKESKPDRLERLIGLESGQFHREVQRFGTADGALYRVERYCIYPKKYSWILDMYNYCSKEDGRLAGPWEGGQFEQGRGRGRRSDLLRFTGRVANGEGLRSVALDYPDVFVKFHGGLQKFHGLVNSPTTQFKAKEVICLIGPTGCGKTSRVVQEFGQSLWFAPANFGTKALWFDGYDGEETALFDDFTGDCDYGTMLRICDGYDIRAPIKGGFTCFVPRRIIFTSNAPVSAWWPGRGEINAFLRRVTKIVTYEDTGFPVPEVAEDNTALLQEPPRGNMDGLENEYDGIDLPIEYRPRDSMDIDEFMSTL